MRPNIKRYGLLSLAFLILGNLFVHFTASEDKLKNSSDLNSKSTKSTPDENAIPKWLQAQLSEKVGVTDIFQLSKLNSPQPKELISTEEISMQAEPQLIPTIPAIPASEPIDLPVKILAINERGNGVSGLIEYNGKTQTVFPGNNIEDRYRVRRIAENTIWLEPL